MATTFVAASCPLAAWAEPPQDDELEIPASPSTPAALETPPRSPRDHNASSGAEADEQRAAASAQTSAIEQRLAELERRLHEAEARQPAPTPTAATPRKLTQSWDVATGVSVGTFKISGYVQTQYEGSQQSEDQLQQGGGALNQNRFVVRRARLRIERQWQFASTTLEFDGNTNRGAVAGLRRAEVSVFVPNESSDGAPPYVMASAGLLDIPFGFEFTEYARRRTFMERSTGSQALFPSENDLGVRISGGVYVFRYSLALLNGQPPDDRSGSPYTDFNTSKDLLTRFGVDAQVSDKLRVSGGTSFLRGKGFHPGQSATKGTVTWRDANENGSLDQGEQVAVPGSAATPSESFDRWAAGVDAQLRVETPIGASFLYGELIFATNLDRGLVPADPIASGLDVRESSYYVGLVQELGKHLLVGLRHDVYDPNADFFDKRAGKLLPATQRVRTTSPIVGVLLPPYARISVQYDFIDDRLGRDARGVPVDLKNNHLTVRLQGEL